MAEGDSKETPVLSLLHVRPLLPSERAAACCNIVNVCENETVNVHGRRYAFDCVVGEAGHSRQHMCEQYIRPLVRNVCNGINCAVLAYGQTSSGKTYTMGIGKEQLQALSAGDEEAVGDLVIPYALRQLFANVAAARGQRNFTLLVSFVEVYMEKYYDLLARRQPVVAKTRCDGEVMLVGAQLRQVTGMDEVIRLLQIGGLARITKGTNQNERSSRSHAVLTIHVQSTAASGPGSADATPRSGPTPVPGSPTRAGGDHLPAALGATPTTSLAAPPARSGPAVDGEDGGVLLSAVMAAPPLSAKLHLVDLAGSESVGRAGTVGLAAKEGNNINLSLMTLRNLIQMLAAPKPQAAAKVVLPYRDSKLTTLLRDALGGNSSTLFVACVSPADANAAMTVSTLEFATTARRIRTKPAVNIGGAGSSAEVLELHRIILKLRNELEQLRRHVLPVSSSPQRQPATCTFSAAVASASMGPSMMLLPSPGQATPTSALFSHGGQGAGYPLPGTFLRVSASGHRTSGSSTPVLLNPTTSRSVNGATSGITTALGDTAATAVGSPMVSQAWGATPQSCGRSRMAQPGREQREEGSDAEAWAEGDGEIRDGGRCSEERTPCSKQSRQQQQQQQHTGAADAPAEGPVLLEGHGHVAGASCPNCGTPLRSLAGGAAGPPAPAPVPHGLTRSDSGISIADSDSSDGCSNSLASVSSYDGSSSGDGHDEWHSTAQLQQRIVLLEAENEHLQKHVGHLSAVIGDLRAQLAGAAQATTPSPLPLTPSVLRAARSSASGASLLGQSVAAVATARLQRMGAASVGGVSSSGLRTSRTTAFSPQQLQHGSPFSAPRLQPPSWADGPGASRVSCEAGGGTPSSRPEGAAPLRPPGLPLSEGRRLPQLQLAGAVSAGGVPRGQWCSAGGWQGLSPQGAGPSSGCGQQSPWSRLPSPGGGGGGLMSAASCPPPSAVHATSTTCVPIEELPESVVRTTEGPLAAATPEEEQDEEEEEQEQEEVAARAVVEPNAELEKGADCQQCGGDSAPASAVPDRSGAMTAARNYAGAGSCEQAGGHVALGPSPFALPPLDCIEDRMLAMLSWVGRKVVETEALLTSQQTALRDLLAGQGLTVSAGPDALPSLDSLHYFAAQQLAGVESELAGLAAAVADAGAGTQPGPGLERGYAPPGSGAGSAGGAAGDTGQDGDQEAEGEDGVSARRAELLRTRLACLKELQAGLQRATELEASLELQREVQMLVAVYAGLHGSGGEDGDGDVAAGPAVARAAATAEQQLQMLRREHRQQVAKDAAVAREKLRELEALTGPPTPQQFGLVVPLGGSSSGGGSSSAAQGQAASRAPSLTLSNSVRSLPSWRAWGSSAGGGGGLGGDGGGGFGGGSSGATIVVDAGEDVEDVDVVERGGLALAASPKAGAAAGVAGASPLLSPLPPLPPAHSAPPAAAPQAHMPSLLSQLLPVLSPGTGWRRSFSAKDTPPPPQPPAQIPAPNSAGPAPGQQLQRSGSWSGHGAPAVAAAAGTNPPARRMLLQLSQLGPWLDALLDYETRLQQYEKVLAGALQEREAVYSQLQEVEQELAAIADAAFASGLASSPAEAHASLGATVAAPGDGAPGAANTNRHGTEGGASFAGWAASPLGTVLAGSDPAVQQQATLLAARQGKLQKRLEELCNDVAALQMAIVEAQEAGSEATTRDEWWACVPSLGMARPALRLLLERAAGYRVAFQDAMTRAGKLEQQVEELGLQYTEAGARLAAHALELTATRAAALAAVAAPGYTGSIGEAVAALLLQHRQRHQERQ